VRWWQKAAAQGDASAHYNLGHLNEHQGEYEAALVHYRAGQAAVQGYAVAQNNLGFMYVNGEGVEKDAVQAVQWYRKAAEQGNATAQSNLGSMYGNGKGVEEDAVQAVQLFRKAAVQGNATAQSNLGSMYGNGEGVQQNSYEAESWWQMAADQGDVNAHFNLGKLNERQGECQAAIVHYRTGQGAVSPEAARTCIWRCVAAVVRVLGSAARQ
jgi:TPR repeat protein